MQDLSNAFIAEEELQVKTCYELISQEHFHIAGFEMGLKESS